MTAPRVAAVVVQFGPEEPCLACLGDIAASRGVATLPLVVDHSPQPSERIEREARRTGGAYVWNAANPGFAAGANAGIREALRAGPAGSLVLLNADVRLDPDCIAELDAILRGDPGIGVVGPGLLSMEDPDVWWNAGSEIFWPSCRPRSLLAGERRAASPRLVADTGFVCGSVLALRPDVLERAGFLSEDYFLYFEDADFAFSVRASGLRVVVARHATAWHRGGGSSEGLDGELRYYRVRNRIRFSRAWNPRPLLGPIHRLLFASRVGMRSLGAFATSLRAAEAPSLQGASRRIPRKKRSAGCFCPVRSPLRAESSRTPAS